MRSDFLQATQHISRAAASASAGQRPLPHGPSKGGAGSSGTGGITWALVAKAAPRVPGAAQTCRITTLWAGLTPQVGLPLAPGGRLCYDFGNRSLEEERTLLSYRASLKLKREKMQKCDYFAFVSIWDGLSCENVDCTAHRWARLELLQRTAPSGTDGESGGPGSCVCHARKRQSLAGLLHSRGTHLRAGIVLAGTRIF